MNKFFDFDDNIDVEIEEDKPLRKDKTEKIKTKDLFSHLKAITELEYDPNYFDELNESDKKTFSVYMINRFLSMNKEWIDVVNYFQQYTQVISPKEAYKFYANIIPKSRVFLKYIKGKTETKYNSELIDIVCQYYQVSLKEAVEYLGIFYIISGGIEQVKELCRMYGRDEKEIKKLINV
jgi:hypothetical protein